MKLEKKSFVHKSFITALISTSEVGGIKEAYPNYFADSRKFANQLSIIIEAEKKARTISPKINEILENKIHGIMLNKVTLQRSL